MAETSSAATASQSAKLAGEETERPVCYSCKQPILTSQFIRVGSFSFHKEHFVCHVCKRLLHDQRPRFRDGIFYCSEDFASMFCHTCRSCGEKIAEGTVIKALNTFFHQHHFVCTTCKQPFKDGKYYEADGQPYCVEHYAEKKSEICEKCGKPVDSVSLVKLKGKCYHVSCVHCHHCKVRLQGRGSIFQKDGHVYCRDDYLSFFSKICSACGEYIVKHILSVNNEFYHPECLKCGVCQEKLSQYIAHEGYLRCANHTNTPMEPPECNGCNKKIINEETQFCLGMKLHAACIKCSFCHTVLEKQKAKLKSNMISCIDCLMAPLDGSATTPSGTTSSSANATSGSSPTPSNASVSGSAVRSSSITSGATTPVEGAGGFSSSSASSSANRPNLVTTSPLAVESFDTFGSPPGSSRVGFSQSASTAPAPSASTGTATTMSASTNGAPSNQSGNFNNSSQTPAASSTFLSTTPAHQRSAGTSTAAMSSLSSPAPAHSPPSASHQASSSQSSASSSSSISSLMPTPEEAKREFRPTDIFSDSPSMCPIEWKRGDLIGKGSFGKVFMGMNVKNGELLAIKQVNLNTTEDQETAMQIQTEITLMENLRHPNIVSLLGTQRTGHKLNIIMEYVPGKSLDVLLEKFGAFHERVIISYARQLLDALAFCHAHGVVHRDIKGKNVLVDTQGNLKLADFGSAKRFKDVLRKDAPSLSYNYTPLWTAPEVLVGDYNSKVDVWSLGCVVIEMATAKPPWSEQNFEHPFRALYHIANDNSIPRIPERLSENGKNFLRLCLRRNPDERPSAAELLNHPWLAKDQPQNSTTTTTTTAAATAAASAPESSSTTQTS